MMTKSKYTAMIATTSAVITLLACATLCKRTCPGGLQLVGAHNTAPLVSSPKTLVIVTHGWLEKGQGSWPEDMAVAIQEHVDANSCLCGYFDWSKGAKAFNATAAAKYARDVAGPQLAKQIIELDDNWQHIHLIGHSSGCWAVSEAAKILTEQIKVDLHLTFFDAYVSVFWEESSLADINTPTGVNCWAEHYYTRDYTLGWTQHNLNFAHNVDITNVDQGIKDHNFPWKWYYATITGKYPKGYLLDNRKLIWTADGIEYGFARSREAYPDRWNNTLKLPVGNEAIELKR